jgi:uncharacterized protein YjbI with pentapeptide repeats
LDFKAELGGPSGWKLFGKLLFAATAAWGIIIGIMTYHSSHLSAIDDRAERSYYQLISDLGHDSASVRIGAITRIPEIMLTRVPRSSDLTPLAALRITFGGELDTYPRYHEDARHLVQVQLHFLSSHPDKWSLSEMQALLQVLREVGPEGWYQAQPLTSPPNYLHSLEWIWKTGHPVDSQPSVTLLDGVRLDGISLRQEYLSGGHFSGASFRSANLSYAHVEHSILSNAHLEFADFSSANLDFASMEGAHADGADFRSAILDHANVKYTSLVNAQLQDISCRGCNMLASNLAHSNCTQADMEGAYIENVSFDGAILGGVDMVGADLRFSSLTAADLSHAHLEHADFGNASLTRARLAGATVNGTSFANADLRGADFSGAIGIEEARNWIDANIAGIRGIQPQLVQRLVALGAVLIQGDEKWKEYKKAGRPHDNWRRYSSSK